MPGEMKNSELDAVGAIVAALKPLDAEVQKRVLSSALALLGIQLPQSVLSPPTPSTSPAPARAVPKDIRTLREEKQPKSDIEMAVLVAYYLAEEASPDARKDLIGPSDITTYFKQARHRLPKGAAQTLRNAKQAGYLDSSAAGEFKLNPVGYNLVVHVLPRSAAKSTRAPAKRRLEAKPKKSSTKRTKAVR